MKNNDLSKVIGVTYDEKEYRPYIFRSHDTFLLPLARFYFYEDGKMVEKTTRDLFYGKRIAIFSLPGAFTPTCTASMVPDYEEVYDELIASGVDDVYCISINDTYVMNAWRESLGVTKVKFIPDGNGFFTRQLNLNVFKTNVGFGVRSWRYSGIINNDMFEVLYAEQGQRDNCTEDPYVESRPEKLLAYLKESDRDSPENYENMPEEMHTELETLESIQTKLYVNKNKLD